MTKKLYFGDNLQILREHIADESVDLIYLDPPFNSKRDYNLLFKTPKGHESDAQITAFEDTWHWGGQAQDEFRELMKCGNSDVSEMMEALRKFLGENDMMAYLTMMCNRLLELHRVLKPTGSLYLHCDPTASHYLKIVLDGVFGKQAFKSEIVWKRTHAHGSAKRYGPLHDIVLFYSKTDTFVWNDPTAPHDPAYVENHFRYVDETNGRRFQAISLTGAGVRSGDSGKHWRGIDPTGVNRHWALPNDLLSRIGFKSGTTQQKLDALDKAGWIYWPKKDGGTPRLKQYADELTGAALGDIWVDIDPISAQAQERLGYPTQKPIALLERIIAASSNEGDVVLDPFCGCGTALDAAQKLKRNWIGIDITHLAVSLIEKRLKDRYPELTAKGAFVIEGVPQDLDAARNLAERDKHQFQLWACSLVGVQPYKGGKKGADQGIDGLGFIEVGKGKTEKVLVSVKGGDHIGASMVRDLKGTVEREKAAIGLFVTLTAPTKPMLTEAASSGHYESPHHGGFPRIQILTIEGLLAGEKPRWPDLSGGQQTFKQAKAETGKPKGKQEKLF
ncbi:MAG: restriction endonuclease [Betaproteobacteria bacterium]|nr:restriction endonuclease [Betaproteobacteria bacterium]